MKALIAEFIGTMFLVLLGDGDQNIYMNVQDIKIEFSDSVINLVRFEAYDFWSKVKNKFL